MADTKISALTALATPDTADELVIVDKSDTSMAATGTDKKITISTLVPGSSSTIQPDDAAADGTAVGFARADHKHAIVSTVPVTFGVGLTANTNTEGTSTSFARADHIHAHPAWGFLPQFQILGAPASTATGVTNTWYALIFSILTASTITGIEVKNGATANGTMKSALYSVVGTKVAERTGTGPTQTGTNVRQQIAFDATYDAGVGTYFALIWFSSATATSFMCPILGNRGGTGTNATNVPTSVTTSDMTATNVAMLRPY